MPLEKEKSKKQLNVHRFYFSVDDDGGGGGGGDGWYCVYV